MHLARLFFGQNELRRPCDRIEGALVAALSAVFLIAAVVAACLAGHIYHSERAATASLRETTAMLSPTGPADTTAGIFAPTAPATWRLADGAEHSGLLTAQVAPAIYQARAGSTVPVWLNGSGQLEPPPPSLSSIVANALITGLIVAGGAAALLLCCYQLGRLTLDRHRLASWGQAWAATGPQWTRRQ